MREGERDGGWEIGWGAVLGYKHVRILIEREQIYTGRRVTVGRRRTGRCGVGGRWKKHLSIERHLDLSVCSESGPLFLWLPPRHSRGRRVNPKERQRERQRKTERDGERGREQERQRERGRTEKGKQLATPKSNASVISPPLKEESSLLSEHGDLAWLCTPRCERRNYTPVHTDATTARTHTPWVLDEVLKSLNNPRSNAATEPQYIHWHLQLKSACLTGGRHNQPLWFLSLSLPLSVFNP